MSKAINRINYFASNGEVVRTGVDAGGYDFLYETSTVKSPNWDIGDHVVLPDGREFVYAKSAEACPTNFGCAFTATGYVAQTVVTVADAIGSRVLHVPAATHAALAADELRGGYVVIGNHSGGQTPAVRRIIGNDASILNVAFLLYLDAPLTVATVVGTTGVEVYQNPFAALEYNTDASLPKAGIPATGVSAANMYFWVQIRGIGYTSSQSGAGDAEDNMVFWKHDGSLNGTETSLGVTIAAYATSQPAGIVVEGSYSGNGPLIMLK